MSEPSQFVILPEMNPSPLNDTEWILDQDWEGPPLNGQVVRIKAGFVTDGASIPQIAWTLIGSPMDRPLLGPALIHDALYAAELTPDHSTADWMFLQYMQMAGIGWVKRNLVWSAVRTWGLTVWNSHTSSSIAASRAKCSLVTDIPKGP